MCEGGGPWLNGQFFRTFTVAPFIMIHLHVYLFLLRISTFHCFPSRSNAYSQSSQISHPIGCRCRKNTKNSLILYQASYLGKNVFASQLKRFSPNWAAHGEKTRIVLLAYI